MEHWHQQGSTDSPRQAARSVGEEVIPKLFLWNKTARLPVDCMHSTGGQLPVHGNDQNFSPARGADSYKLGVTASNRDHFEPEPAEQADDFASREPFQTRHERGRTEVS